jgi:hypothetical protein
MENNSITLHMLGTCLDYLGKTRIEWIGKANVSNDTALEEGKGADTLCAVNGLVGYHEVHWLNLLLQRADGGKGNDAAHANVAQGSNVGSVGDFVGSELVVHAVASEEGDIGALVGEDLDRRRGRAPRGLGVEDGHGLEALELGEAGAANDGDMNGLYESRDMVSC